MFEIGDRVFLREDNQYGSSATNPALGSKWECAGTITEDYGGEYEVDWDNGEMNSGYEASDLTRAHKPTNSMTDW